MLIAVIKAEGTRAQLEEEIIRSGLAYQQAMVCDNPLDAQLYLREEELRLEYRNRDETQPFLPFL